MSESDSIFNGVIEFARRDAITYRISVLKKEIFKRPECGDCYHWMHSGDCPSERHNMSGYPSGPSMSGITCEKFEEKEWVTKLRNERREELERLKEELK
jgi:hypothetical protein